MTENSATASEDRLAREAEQARAEQEAREVERADVDKITASVRSQAERASFGAGVSAAQRKLLKPLLRAAEYGSLRENLTELQRDLSGLLAILKKAREDLNQVERMRADSERFGTVWWRQRQRLISDRPSPEQRSAEWVKVFAEALLEERFDVCARLAAPDFPELPRDELLVRLARAGTRALEEGRWAAAAPLLRLLVDGPWGATLWPAQRASIELLLARVLMPIAAERSGVRRRLQDALDRPGEDDTERALFAVGLGECSLTAGDLAAAAASFEEAAELSPEDPAPYVGLGLVEERRRTWLSALDQYDQAAAREPDGHALARLRAPVSGNLYWRLAIKLGGVGESPDAPDLAVPEERRRAALEAIDDALRRGISGRGDSPERKALIYKAGLLESLGRPREAAGAYYDASQRFQPQTEDAAACKYLEKACELGPTVPVHHWALAEAMRRLAYDKGGRGNLAQLDQAIERWQDGAAVGQPTPGEAWAYATLAFAKIDREASARRSTLWEGAALTERAVLLDGTYVLGWSILALVHNMMGNPWTALAAADRALAVEASESTALEQRTIALASLERLTEARQAAQSLSTGSGSGLWPRMYVLLVARQPDEAFGLLSDLPLENDAVLRWYRAGCNKCRNRDGEEVEDLRWIWEHRDEEDLALGPGNLAWAAYRLGYYDQAEERYWQILDIRDQSVLDPDAACDLGQLFLERGDTARQDLANGEALLKAGVDQHRLADLGLFEDIELPQLQRRVAGQPHADRVGAIVGDVLAALRKRRAALADPSVTAEAEMRWALDAYLAGQPVILTAEKPGDAPADPTAEDGAWRSARRQAAHAALGRMAMTEKRWPDAAEAYVALGQDGLPEAAAVGFTRAVAAMRAKADKMAVSGDLDAAGAQYARLAEQVAAEAPDEHELQAWLLCRVAMAGAASADGGTARNSFETAAGLLAERSADRGADEAGNGPQELARIFASSVPAFWAQTDALTSVRDDPALTERARALVKDILAALSLDETYKMRSSDVDSAATFPLTNVVVLSLGTGLTPEDTSEHWPLRGTLLAGMRAHIEQVYGIRIPGVSIQQNADLAPAGFEIRLDGIVVRSGEVPDVDSSPGQPPPLDGVVASLQNVLVGNLGRLLGPDDLITWAASSPTAAPGDSVGQEVLADAETRLRVQRVLRLLLRERVPVTDRQAVLGATAAAVTGGADTLTALDSVRSRLAPALPGAEPGTRLEPLPQELESAVAQGVRADHPAGTGGPAWQAPRAEADRLVGQLREHLSSLPADTAVSVRDPDVRSFVVRLLSGALFRRPVLTDAERQAATDPRSDAMGASAEEPTG